MNKEKNSEKNLLDWIPVRTIEWQQAADGRIYLVKEKSKNKIIKKIIEIFSKRQFFHIYLDDLGREVWLLTDGKRNVNQICQILKERIGNSFKQPEQRISSYFVILRKHGFIRFEESSE